jgi:hypothetical protein
MKDQLKVHHFSDKVDVQVASKTALQEIFQTNEGILAKVCTC